MDEQKDTSGETSARQDAPAANSPVDIEKLTEKVYQLMRAEARLSRVRGDQRGTRR